MKNLKTPLLLGLLALLAASCAKGVDNEAPSLQPTNLKSAAAMYDQMREQIAKIDAASDQSGLTALVLSSDHTWEELDAYYQRIDALTYPDNIKQALKDKALFGLVEIHHFLDKAPLEKRTYYADQLFAQQYFDPKLAVAFLENLRKQWPAEKLAAAKEKTGQQLRYQLARTTRRPPDNLLLPNTEEVRKAKASAEKMQQAQAQKLHLLEQRLAVL